MFVFENIGKMFEASITKLVTVDEMVCLSKILISMNNILMKQFEEFAPPSSFISYVKNIHECIYTFTEKLLTNKFTEIDFISHSTTYEGIAKSTLSNINE